MNLVIHVCHLIINEKLLIRYNIILVEKCKVMTLISLHSMGSKWYAGFECIMRVKWRKQAILWGFSNDFDHWCWYETMRFFFFFCPISSLWMSCLLSHSACWCYWTVLWTELDCCKCTFTQRRTFWSRSTHRQEFLAPLHDFVDSWVNSHGGSICTLTLTSVL